MNLKIYLINLKRSTERLEYMRKQLNNQGVEFEIFEAYDGKVLTNDFLHQNANMTVIKQKQMPLGAIGCSFSHLFIYKLISEREDPIILVLEDDMLLEDNFSKIVKKAAEFVSDGEIIFPYFIPKPNCKLTTDQEIKIDHKHSIKSFVDYHRALATGAYLLTKKTASQLYFGLSPITTFADDWPYFYEKGLVNKFKTIYPLLARSADFRSEIGYLKDKPIVKSIVNFIQDKTPVLNWFFKLNRKRVADKLRNQIVLTHEKISH